LLCCLIARIGLSTVPGSSCSQWPRADRSPGSWLPALIRRNGREAAARPGSPSASPAGSLFSLGFSVAAQKSADLAYRLRADVAAGSHLARPVMPAAAGFAQRSASGGNAKHRSDGAPGARDR